MSNTERFSMNNIRQMISSFVKNEIGEGDVGKSKYKRKTGINVIKSEKMSRIVSRGIATKRIITSISADLARIDGVLKKFGLEKIRELNSNGDNVKSVRIASTNDDLSVLVTAKPASLDGKKAEAVKEEMGSDFSKFFAEKETWTINPDFVEKCILTLRGTFGQNFVNQALNKRVAYSVRSKEDLDKLLAGELSESLRQKLSAFVKPTEVSITYPK